MSQTSTSHPKDMPSYSNLWEACIANLCHLPPTQTQRCPAPPMPAAPSTTMASCSLPHLETTLWKALRPQTTSPSETSSQSTTCPMEKPFNGSTTQPALPQPRGKALTATATTPPIPAHLHHQTLSSPRLNDAASAVGDTRWHSRPGTPRPLQMEEELVFITHNPHWARSPPASPRKDQLPLKTFPQMTPPHQEDTTFHPLVRTPRHQPKPRNLQYWEASKNTKDFYDLIRSLFPFCNIV